MLIEAFLIEAFLFAEALYTPISAAPCCGGL
jgi:hypothetical protein